MDLERLKGIAASAVERIGAAFDLAALAAAEADVAGAGSEIATLRRAMRDVAPDERPEAGRRINEAAGVIAAAVEARRIVLQADADNARLSGDAVDVTLPGAIPPRGATHLVMQVWEEITDIFVGLGYTVASGPEVETDYYNFKALNYPDAHPARLETDTLYIAHGTDPEGVLLRTQTSTVQVRYMETHPPPVYIVSPGRVYRRDTIDATHTPVFHQMEGLAVDSDITFADLKERCTISPTNSSVPAGGSESCPTSFPSPNHRPRCTSRASAAKVVAVAFVARQDGSNCSAAGWSIRTSSQPWVTTLRRSRASPSAWASTASR